MTCEFVMIIMYVCAMLESNFDVLNILSTGLLQIERGDLRLRYINISDLSL